MISKEFKDYDMRRMSIKDIKDVYAFIDAVERGLPKVKRVVMSLNSSANSSKNIIKNLERKLSDKPRTVSEEEQITEAGNVIQTLRKDAPLLDKEEFLNKMRESREKEKYSSKPLSAPVSHENEKDDKSSVLERKERNETGTSVVGPKRPDYIDGYTVARFKNNQYRFYATDGKMVSASKIPEGIQEKLIDEYNLINGE